MKKTLKKAIIAITAVALVSASVAFSAFAADPAVSATYADNKITLAITGAAKGQVTVLVTDVNAQTVVAENIFYINQDASENGSLTYTFDSNLPDGTYEVRVGGAGAGTDGFLTTTFTIGNAIQPTADPTQPTADPTQPTADPTQPTADPTQPTTPPVTGDYKIGDVNEDGEVDSSDSLAVLLNYANGTEYKAPLLVGDVNNDGEVDSSDSLAILLNYANGTPFTRTEI